MKVLVTGGCGYIGSHTIVDLIQAGYEVICIDNNSRSNCNIHANIEVLTGNHVPHYTADLRELKSLETVFDENKNVGAILHFAAFKCVGESVENPLLYYENNVIGLLNLLKCVNKYNIPYFVFSSSCTVYGQPDKMPVTELTPMKPPTSPYGATKQMCEHILRDFFQRKSRPKNQKVCILRYFNPAGAHPSLLIGENPNVGVPSLTTAIVSAVKNQQSIHVFGSDYNTKDGTCVRDFIHVCDIAHAHTLAIHYLMNSKDKPVSTYNLGAGKPHTVLEAIGIFSKVNALPMPIQMKERRQGDAEAIYANCELAKKELGWVPVYTIEDIMKTAYLYDQKYTT